MNHFVEIPSINVLDVLYVCDLNAIKTAAAAAAAAVVVVDDAAADAATIVMCFLIKHGRCCC